jgi:hypothetical protein|tara:strand:- start:2761 stop:3069 length:309 start_codon:yes stop_codon:yes gene_type:complete
MVRFASGRNALAECDICGFRYYLRELRSEVVKGRETNIKACPTCWSPDHPQNKLGELPINDPQAIRDPRPDFAGYAASRKKIYPVTPISVGIWVGSVTVSTP